MCLNRLADLAQSQNYQTRQLPRFRPRAWNYAA